MIEERMELLKRLIRNGLRWLCVVARGIRKVPRYPIYSGWHWTLEKARPAQNKSENEC